MCLLVVRANKALLLLLLQKDSIFGALKITHYQSGEVHFDFYHLINSILNNFIGIPMSLFQSMARHLHLPRFQVGMDPVVEHH